MNSMIKTILISNIVLAIAATTQCAEQQPQPTRRIATIASMARVSLARSGSRASSPIPNRLALLRARREAAAPKASVTPIKHQSFAQRPPIAIAVLSESLAMYKKYSPVEKPLKALEQEEANLHCELYQVEKRDEKAIKKQKQAHQQILDNLRKTQTIQKDQLNIAYALPQDTLILLASAQKLLQEYHEQSLKVEEQRQTKKQQNLREFQAERKEKLGRHIQQTAQAQIPLRQQKEQLDKEHQDRYAALCTSKRQRRS